MPAVTSIAADPTAPWTKFSGDPVNNAAYTIAANTVQAIAPQTPGTVYSDSQTTIPNMIESVLNGTSLQTALNTLQTATESDYATAKAGL